MDLPSFFRWHGLWVIEILYEYDLVLHFDMQKFVVGLRHQDSKSTGPNPAFFTNGHVGYRFGFRLADGAACESPSKEKPWPGSAMCA